MRMCVSMISLFLVSSTYLSNISLAVSYYLECRRAYVSDIVFNCLSRALGDCLRTSNNLSVGEFDNEKSCRVFRLISHDIYLCFYAFYHLLLPFYLFCSCYAISFNFWKPCGKGAKYELKRRKRANFMHSVQMAFAIQKMTFAIHFVVT